MDQKNSDSIVDNRSRIAQIIKEMPNPFSESSVGDAWTEIVDVPEINKEITDIILRTIKKVKEEHINQWLMVLGEPGSGKTHLLARIQRIAESQHYFLYVYIKPIGDITKINQHILRELMVSLLKQIEQRNYPPLFQFIGHIILKYIIQFEKVKKAPIYTDLLESITSRERAIEETFNKLKKLDLAAREKIFTDIINEITFSHPNIDSIFLKMLFTLLDDNLKSIALDWLKCIDLSEESLEKLKITFSINSEDIAFNVLNAFFELAQGPIMLCLDQIESIFDRFQDENGIKILFDNLMNYFNQFKNLSIVVMCNTVYWSEKIQPIISGAVKGRIGLIKNLKKMSNEDTRLLVEKRIEVKCKIPGKIPYSTFPFPIEYINEVAQKASWNPRNFLKVLEADFEKYKQDQNLVEFPTTLHTHEETSPSPIPTMHSASRTEFLKKLHSQESNNIFQELNNINYSEREELVVGILGDIFKDCNRNKIPIYGHIIKELIPNVAKTKAQKPLSFMMKLNEGTNKIILIHVCNSENGTSLASFMKKIKEYVENNDMLTAFLIRDENLVIHSKLTVTNKIIQEHPDRIKVIYISGSQLSFFISLKKILEKATGGDLQIDSQIITRTDVLSFIHDTISTSANFLDSIFDGKFKNSLKIEPKEPMSPNLTGQTSQSGNLTSQSGTLTSQSDQSSDSSILNPSDIKNNIMSMLRALPICNTIKIAKQLQIDQKIVNKLCNDLVQEKKITILVTSSDEGNLIVPLPGEYKPGL